MNKQEVYNKMINALRTELNNDQLQLDSYDFTQGNGILMITTRTSKVPEPSNDNNDFGSAGDWNTANGWYTG
ncbi:hypothetical protein [Staphylococcus epidermidis]|uniref:hypothetical protein n=1 Tax=Staphylococcus epidermidis TaxID=1282 RepID=UPI0027383482|nr:hypothetical protein [Staphylococcus epidermidis]